MSIQRAQIGRATGRVQAWDPALHDGVIEPAESMAQRLREEWPAIVAAAGARIVGEIKLGKVETDRAGRRFMTCWAHTVEDRVPEDVSAQLTPYDFRYGHVAWNE